MKSIKETIDQMSKSSNFKKNYEAIQKGVHHNHHIKAFLRDHPDANPDMINRHLSKAFEYVNGRQHCDNCPGLDQCPNLLKGYQPKLIVDKQAIEVQYEPCHLKLKQDRMKRQSQLIKSFYVPKDIFTATFETIDTKDNRRHQAIQAAAEFVTEFQKGNKTKGLYLHGKFGVGKTYIMGAIMNEFAEVLQIESLMVYTPDFFRELKSAISDQTLSEKLDYIKKSPLLILDDIGAETMSPWIRDDILGSILQHRIMDEKPTLFTSNFDYEELEDHLAYSNKTGTELLKAKRIMERIRHYSKPISMEGPNRREFH